MFDRLEDPRKVFGAAVLEAAKGRSEVCVLSADSGGSSGFGAFREAHPERYFEFGIMEQGVVGFASGLATTGKIPVFCAIAPFVTARPFEMFRNDLGYMGQNVKIVGRNAGISYSDLGATHHSLEDFAIIRMIPGVTVLAPCDPDEIRSAAAAMLEHTGPVYMRIGNDPIPNLFPAAPFDIGKARVALEGGDVTIVTTGSIAANVMKAALLLKERGVSAEVITAPTVVPFDRECVINSVKKTGRAVTVEEHYVIGGIGTLVQEAVCECYPVPVRKLGLPHGYITSGPYHELLAYYGLDEAGIAGSVLAVL